MIYPKIGIRPIIDGRRNGVRESLEDQTMGMAKSVADLYTKTLRYPDGSPVECVIADSTIGGCKEACDCAEKFKRENVGVVISVTPCWCYGTETIDLDQTLPHAIYGFNGTERPGAVYLAAALAAHSQKGIPAFSIYGHDVLDADNKNIPADVEEKLLRFARAGLAAAIMRGKCYLSIGGVAMGIAGSMVDDNFFQEYLGIRCEYNDMVEIIRRMDKGIYDHDEYEKAIKWVKENCKEGKDYFKNLSLDEKQKNWEFVVKMTMIIRDMMEGNPKLAQMGFVEESNGHNAIAAGFQGQRQWTDFYPNGDFSEAILNSSFDWNGIRRPYIVATENDCLNGVSMLFGHLLTNTPQVFCDVRTYWSPDAFRRVTGEELPQDAKDGFIHLINSGAACLDGTGRQTKDSKPAIKPFWEITQAEKQACLDATVWCHANPGYFRGGGYSSHFRTVPGMPMTMIRLSLVKGLGPVLCIAEGYSVDISDKAFDIINERTDPTWPTTFFAPIITQKGSFTSTYEVMKNWSANHCALSYGHIGADLISLASILRIPVSMHNVDPEKIFRPSTWSMFGTENPESADFLACKNFGPLY